MASSSGIQVGQWVRLFQPNSDATRRRQLLAAAHDARRRLAQAEAPMPAVPAGKVTVWGVSWLAGWEGKAGLTSGFPGVLYSQWQPGATLPVTKRPM